MFACVRGKHLDAEDATYCAGGYHAYALMHSKHSLCELVYNDAVIGVSPIYRVS
jgi:hypothetical protein